MIFVTFTIFGTLLFGKFEILMKYVTFGTLKILVTIRPIGYLGHL